MRYSSDNQYQWSRVIPGEGMGSATQSASFEDQKILIAGNEWGETNFDNGNIVSFPSSSSFITTINLTSVSGSTLAQESPLSNVSLKFSDGLASTVYSDSSGHYLLKGVPQGIPFLVTPRKEGYVFRPSSLGGITGAQNTTDFIATEVYSIDGFVTLNGEPLPNALMIGSGLFGTVRTDERGYYSVSNLKKGSHLSLRPSLYGHSFYPPQVSEVVSSDRKIDFNAVSSYTGPEQEKVTRSKWLKTINAEDDDSELDVSFVVNNPNGDSLVVGDASGAIQLDPTSPLPTLSSPSTSRFIASYNSDGEFLWVLTFSSDLYIHAATYDEHGNILIGGDFTGTTDLDGTSGQDSRTIMYNYTGSFVSRYESTGEYLGSVVIATHATHQQNYHRIIGVTKCPQDGIYIYGTFYNGIDFDPSGDSDIHFAGLVSNSYISKFSDDMEYLWTQTIMNDNGATIAGLACKSADSIVITGRAYEEDTIFDPDGSEFTLESGESSYSFLAEYSNTGGLLGAKVLCQSSDMCETRGLAQDGDSNTLAFGLASDSVTFDPQGASDTDSSHYLNETTFFLSKYSASGSYLWTRPLAGNIQDFFVADDGRVYITGSFEQTLAFNVIEGSDSYSPTGQEAAFVTIINPDGSYGSTLVLNALDYDSSVSSYKSFSVGADFILVGSFSGAVDLDPSELVLTPPASEYWSPFFFLRLSLDPVHNGRNFIDGIVLQNGSPLQSITITLSGDYTGSVITDSKGEFSFSGLPLGAEYSLTPSYFNYYFSPSRINSTLVGDSYHRLEAISPRRIFGTVKLGSESLPGVSVKGSASLSTIVTDSSGFFSFEGVTPGQSYQIEPTLSGYRFEPPSATVTLQADTQINFVAIEIDTDQDGVSDNQEVLDNTNPLDRGSFLERLGTSICGNWNSFLGMVNILEHLSTSNGRNLVVDKIYDPFGKVKTESTFGLKPAGSSDLVFNSLPGFAPNSYGLACSSLPSGVDGELDARLLQYGIDSTGGINFVLANHFGSGTTGEQYVQYNTYHPSWDVRDASDKTTVWIQLSNLENTKQSGIIIYYDQRGSVVHGQPVTIPARGRTDYPLPISEPRSVGLVRWWPADSNSRFIFSSTRYYHDIGLVETSFDGAVTLESAPGSGELLSAPVITDSLDAIAEISNLLDVTNTVAMQIYDEQGALVKEELIRLHPRATYHLFLDTYLKGKNGLLSVRGESAESLIATVMQYGRNDSLGLLSSYSLALRQPLGTSLKGSFNTFLKQDCNLLITNLSEQSSTATISATDYSHTKLILGDTVSINAKGMTSYALCDHLNKADTYGVVTVTPSLPNAFQSTLIRIGENRDYMIALPLRN